ncbi:MAG: TlpA disulfide reductase family protein [Burkholderiales bacterium]
MKLSIKQISLVVAAIAIAIAIAIAAWLALFRTPAAPQVRFTTLEGETLTTAGLRGKVVMVNFWATSCEPCVGEMPQIIDTWNKYHDRGFETIAVAMSYDPPNRVLDYAERNRLPFKVALDPVGDAARSFGDVRFTPTTFIIDRRGNIVQQYLGAPDFARFHALLEARLREPA